MPKNEFSVQGTAVTIREKIILTIMCLTLIWGGYMLFGDPAKTSSSKASAQDTTLREKKFINDLSSKLDRQKPDDTEVQTLRSAADPWRKDPFLSPAEGLHAKKNNTSNNPSVETTAAVANWVYSGYLEAEGKRLAIINGLEYEEGESLDPSGYYLARIQKNHVIIGVVGQRAGFTLPLIEP